VSDARAEILARVRGALTDVREHERERDREGEAAPTAVPRDYERERHDPRMLELLAERLTEYRARVERTALADVRVVAARVCAELGLDRLVVAGGVPEAWRPHGVELLDEGDGVDPRELDALDGVLSGCAVAIAETGTIVLDGGARSGRRAITLVPDHHICVVEAEQVVMLVPEAFARLEQAVRDRRAPITLVSGPSATSDIELSRVEGVHGPRTLVVVLAE
jgi:L-lactate dehydrogenase complex protein LldG